MTITVKVPLADGTQLNGLPVDPLHPAGSPE